MKLIPLTQGQHAVVDDGDFKRLNAHRWYALAWTNGSGKFYAVRSTPRPDGGSRRLFMHREILDIDADLRVDHINGDSLDNRRQNLRPCTTQQNNFNRRRRKTGSYHGVEFNNGRWLAVIHEGKRRVVLGSHHTPKAAAQAYDAEAIRRRGQFAQLNFRLHDDALSLSAEETAAALGISRATLMKSWRAEARRIQFPAPYLLARSIGHPVSTWRLDELEAWLMRQQSRPTHSDPDTRNRP